MATGCGDVDNKIGKKNNLVEIAPLDDEAKYLPGFDFLTGKVATLQGVECDATPFCGVNVSDIGKVLSTKCGFHSSGKEVMYNGKTGEQLNCDIFIGPTHYYRLKHLVALLTVED